VPICRGTEFHGVDAGELCQMTGALPVDVLLDFMAVILDDPGRRKEGEKERGEERKGEQSRE
jgi:hypothetical protein